MEVSEMLGVGWPLKPLPGTYEGSLVQALVTLAALVALAVIYIVAVKRADERMKERRAEPEAPEVRKAA